MATIRGSPSRAIGLALLALIATVSGCVSSDDESQAADGATDGVPTDPAPPPQTNATSGSIAGIVADAESLPLGGVSVSILETLAATKTDKEGRFTFNGVQPGEYRLVFDRIGYEQAAKRVTVAAGQVAEVSVALQPLAITSEPYHASVVNTAHIHFSWVFFQDAIDLVNHTATNNATCDPCQFVIFIEPGPEDAVTETVWEASGNAYVNSEVWLYVKTDWTTGNFGDGTSLVATYFSNRESHRWGDTASGSLKNTTALLVDVYGGFAGVNLDHKLDIWNSFGYAGELPDGFTALPPE